MPRGARRRACPRRSRYRPKWKIALDEIDRVLASGARFGAVLADAEYGRAAEFRAGLAERRSHLRGGHHAGRSRSTRPT